jgi:ADP-heptose:LPS heptosyltransferase
MAWKRDTLEFATRFCATLAPRSAALPSEPQSIFVLRNNDLGDVLVVTPLFEALRRRFPRAKIVAGVGDWAAPVLAGNPYVDETLPINAPWHNGQVRPQGVASALSYIAASREAARLAARRFDIGIDVLGSAFGSLLMMRAGIPYRLGVRGYAGGHSAALRCIEYDAREHVGRSALRFAELLGATDLPENRPQIHLGAAPVSNGGIAFAPGGGYAEKCWPLENFVALAKLLPDFKITVIGGERDRPAGARLTSASPGVSDFTGRLSLMESFAAIAAARVVVCNSSMAMHAAAAFRKPCLVLLGAGIPSALAHADQWAYPETRVLAQASPEQARDHILQALSAVP